MSSISSKDQAIGIVLVVVGALALLGWLNLGWIVTVAAVVAVVVGIMILAGSFDGSQLMGIILLAVGILLLVPNFVGAALGNALSTIAAVVLLALGVLRLLGKW